MGRASGAQLPRGYPQFEGVAWEAAAVPHRLVRTRAGAGGLTAGLVLRRFRGRGSVPSSRREDWLQLGGGGGKRRVHQLPRGGGGTPGPQPARHLHQHVAAHQGARSLLHTRSTLASQSLLHTRPTSLAPPLWPAASSRCLSRRRSHRHDGCQGSIHASAPPPRGPSALAMRRLAASLLCSHGVGAVCGWGGGTLRRTRTN